MIKKKAASRTRLLTKQRTCRRAKYLFIYKLIKKMEKERKKKVVNMATENTLFCKKEVLTSEEAARYMGISKSYLYKLTMGQKIPHFKPMGKMCYFNRVELEQWLQSNRVATKEEIINRANNYLMKGGVKK